MHKKITRREFALRVAALAAGAATSSFRIVYADETVNPSVETPMKPTANLILQNGRITTLDPKHPEAKEVIIADGRIAGVDNAADFQSGPETKVVDLRGRRVIPGLYDSHLHVIRGGLELQHGAALGGRAFGVARLANAARAGSPHARAAVGARGRRMERIPVRRAAHADAG